jgi:hypothetical protein
MLTLQGFSKPKIYVKNGTLYKSGLHFKIDHPLNPANKHLYHSTVESPDMKNLYDGWIAGGKNMPPV